MASNERKFVVMGEASESDEEDPSKGSTPKKESLMVQCVKPIVVGEASESDYDSDDYYDLAASFQKRSQEKQNKRKHPKYNSLLHKKLREDNLKLKDGMDQYIRSAYNWNGSQVGKVNQQLLTSQVQLQECATSLRKASTHMVRLNQLLDKLDPAAFIPTLNVEAFPNACKSFQT